LILVRRKWSGQLVPIGANWSSAAGIHELQHLGRVGEVARLRLGPADAAADQRHQPPGRGAPGLGGQRGHPFAAKDRAPDVRLQPDGGLVDHFQRQQIAILRRIRPGEQPMLAQHHALQARVLFGHPAQLDAQVDARPLPRQIAQGAAENLLCQAHLIGAGGNRDDGIGMHVVDMRARDEAVQPGVDRRRTRVEVPDAMPQRLDHRVFLVRPRYCARNCISRSMYSVANPSSFMLPMSPPEPLTHSTCTSAPVSGSFAATLAEVLPPPKLVIRRSEPSRFDRYKQLARFVQGGGMGVIPQGFQQDILGHRCGSHVWKLPQRIRARRSPSITKRHSAPRRIFRNAALRLFVDASERF
jgi:hypothetical protein